MHYEKERQKIVIFRALKLGDMLCAIPTFRALRMAYPDACISLISNPVMEDMFERYGHYIDEFIPFPGFPGMPERKVNPKKSIDFIAEIQKRKFDLAIQLHGSGELSNSIITLFNAQQTAGFYRHQSFRPDNGTFIPYPDEKHEIHRCLALIEHMNIELPSDELEFPLREADEATLKRTLETQGILLSDKPYYCIHPGASTESKRWSREHFARVGDYLANKGFNVVFTGSLQENELIDSIIFEMDNDAINTGLYNFPLGPLAALINESIGVICNDTGVSHLCAALKKASIVIFSETEPHRWAPLNKKLHRSFVRPGLEQILSEIDQFLLKTNSFELKEMMI